MDLPSSAGGAAKVTYGGDCVIGVTQMGTKIAFSRRKFLAAGLLGAASAATEGIAMPTWAGAVMPTLTTTPPTLPALSGTTSDATAALTSYLARAGASATIVGDYFIDGEVVIPHSVTSLQLPAGTRLKVRGDHSALRRSGTVTFRELLAANVAAGDTSISPTNIGAYTVGEYILVTSYDTIANSTNKYGYLRKVTGKSSGKVQVDGGIPRLMVTQPRTAALALAPTIRIFGAGEIFAVDPTVTKGSLIAFVAVDNPRVEGIELHHSGASGIGLVHCNGGTINCTIHDLLDDGVNYFGYGVNVIGACRGLVVAGTISRVRHAVTTNGAPSITGIGPAGEPEDCRFEPIISGCSDKSLDTHRVGWNITMVPHITGGRGGIQIRADNVHVEGGTIFDSAGPGIAVDAVVAVAPVISGVLISYLRPSGTALLCNAPSNISDVDIRDCYGNNIVLSNNCVVRGGTISAGGSVGVQFLGSNNVVEGIQLGPSVTTPYIEAAGAVNNTFSTAEPTDIETMAAPTPSKLPAISGELVVGQQLRTTSGTWSPGPVTHTYSWFRDGAPIAGAQNRINALYNTVSVDAGKTLSVLVTADRPGYARGSVMSPSTAPVSAGPALVASVMPTITGTAEIGKYLQVSSGTWSPSAQNWAYAWLVDGVVVPGLAANRVQIQSSWAGKSVSAQVTASRAGFNPGSATTAPVKMPPAAIKNTVAPVLSGTGQIGTYLTASGGSWSPYVSSRTFQWLVDGVVVAGLTTNRVQVKSTWAGKSVKARVTALKSGWTSTSVDTKAIAVAPVGLTCTSRPVLTGTPQVGQFLTVSRGTWSPAGTSYSVAWYVGGVVVPNLAVTRVQVKSAWKGKTIVAKITAQREGFTSTSASSQSLLVS
jgi:hypothetical protein